DHVRLEVRAAVGERRVARRLLDRADVVDPERQVQAALVRFEQELRDPGVGLGLDDLLDADLGHQLDERGVHRVLRRGDHVDRGADVVAVWDDHRVGVVLRHHVAVRADRRLRPSLEEALQAVVLLQGRRQHVRLHRGAALRRALPHVVELLVQVARTAVERDDLAVRGVHRHQPDADLLLRELLRVHLRDGLLGRLLGHRHALAVEGGVDAQALGRQLLLVDPHAAELFLGAHQHVAALPVVQLVAGVHAPHLGQALLDVLVRIALAELAHRDHALERVRVALGRPRPVRLGLRVPVRVLDDAAEDGRLVRVELPHVLAEVLAGRGLDAVGVAAEVDGVQVELEDLVLGVLVLQLQRDEQLLELPAHRPVVRVGVVVLRQLLRDRGPAARPPGQVVPHRAGRALDREAGVAVEAAVLRRQHRVADVRRDLVELDALPLLADPADLGAVGVVEDRRLVLDARHGRLRRRRGVRVRDPDQRRDRRDAQVGDTGHDRPGRDAPPPPRVRGPQVTDDPGLLGRGPTGTSRPAGAARTPGPAGPAGSHGAAGPVRRPDALALELGGDLLPELLAGLAELAELVLQSGLASRGTETGGAGRARGPGGGRRTGGSGGHTAHAVPGGHAGRRTESGGRPRPPAAGHAMARPVRTDGGPGRGGSRTAEGTGSGSTAAGRVRTRVAADGRTGGGRSRPMAAGPARPTGPATGTGRARGTPRAETALGPGGTRTVPARSARAESRMRTTGARRTLRPRAGTALRRAAGRRGATGRTGAARA